MYIITALCLSQQQAHAGKYASPVVTWFETVDNGDIESLKAQLAKFGNIVVNTRDDNRNTALIKAAVAGNSQMVSYLLTVPTIGVNLQNKDGFSALLAAVFWCHEDVTNILLDVPNINTNQQMSDGHTIFSLSKVVPKIEAIIIKKVKCKQWFLAAKNGNLPLIRELSSKVDVNLQNDDGETALILAALSGQEHITRFLLKMQGIDINIQDQQGNTALICAVYGRHRAIIELLIKSSKINLNAQKSDYNTALLLAIEWDDEKIALLLLDAPEIDINIQGKYGNTALILAVREERYDIVRKLLNMPGINIKAKNDSGKTAFDYAGKYIIPNLLKNKLNELTRLAFNAIKQNDLETLKLVTAQIGIDEIEDKRKNTLLDIAFNTENTEIIEFLLQNADNPQELLARFPFDKINPGSKLFKYFVALGYGLQGEPADCPKNPKKRKHYAELICCSNCGAEHCQMRCSNCKDVYYCSEKCQKAHWKYHKKHCKN